MLLTWFGDEKLDKQRRQRLKRIKGNHRVVIFISHRQFHVNS